MRSRCRGVGLISLLILVAASCTTTTSQGTEDQDDHISTTARSSSTKISATASLGSTTTPSSHGSTTPDRTVQLTPAGGDRQLTCDHWFKEKNQVPVLSVGSGVGLEGFGGNPNPLKVTAEPNSGPAYYFSKAPLIVPAGAGKIRLAIEDAKDSYLIWVPLTEWSRGVHNPPLFTWAATTLTINACPSDEALLLGGLLSKDPHECFKFVVEAKGKRTTTNMSIAKTPC